MALRFRPVDTAFYDLFTEQAQHTVTGAALLAEMLAETSDREDVAARMRAAEHDADETTHALVRRVGSTFVTPFDREDIYALASALDDVMDEMDRAVDLILVYQVKILPAELSQQVEVLQRCAELTAAAMPALPNRSAVGDFVIEVNRLENSGDKLHRRSMAKLFSGEFKAIEVIKLKDVVDSLEAAVDAFERVAHVMEQIALKDG